MTKDFINLFLLQLLQYLMGAYFIGYIIYGFLYFRRVFFRKNDAESQKNLDESFYPKVIKASAVLQRAFPILFSLIMICLSIILGHTTYNIIRESPNMRGNGLVMTFISGAVFAFFTGICQTKYIIKSFTFKAESNEYAVTFKDFFTSREIQYNNLSDCGLTEDIRSAKIYLLINTKEDRFTKSEQEAILLSGFNFSDAYMLAGIIKAKINKERISEDMSESLPEKNGN